MYKGKEKVLDKYVSHYAVMENYIYLETMRDYNSNVVLLYYLVDMDTNEVFGPYTTHTIMEAMGERGLILEDTIDTTVRRQNGNREEFDHYIYEPCINLNYDYKSINLINKNDI